MKKTPEQVREELAKRGLAVLQDAMNVIAERQRWNLEHPDQTQLPTTFYDESRLHAQRLVKAIDAGEKLDARYIGDLQAVMQYDLVLFHGSADAQEVAAKQLLKALAVWRKDRNPKTEAAVATARNVLKAALDSDK